MLSRVIILFNSVQFKADVIIFTLQTLKQVIFIDLFMKLSVYFPLNISRWIQYRFQSFSPETKYVASAASSVYHLIFMKLYYHYMLWIRFDHDWILSAFLSQLEL